MGVFVDELSRELRPPLTAEAAVVEADRCLECGGVHALPPCVVGCPANVDVPGFVAAIAAGDPATAARTIFAENVLGGTCARVCPAEVLCQRDCVLIHERRPPIEIGALQRYATDWAYANGVPLRPKAEAKGRRVAVVGAGPAGLAAAGELAARGYAVTVYDEREEVGGLVRYAIAPYRQTNEPLPDEARLLADLGVEFRLGERVGSARLQELAAEVDAIVLAVGMGPDLDVVYEGDDLDGVWESLPFIERLKTGEPPAVGERVAVVGGGNTAVDVAVESKRLGAEVSLLLYRRTEQEMPAYEHEVELARSEGVEIRFLTSPIAFVGEDRVEGVRCAKMRLGAPDETGRRRPEPVPDSEFVIPVDTVVKAIGQRPRDEFRVLLESVDRDGRTRSTRIFAAGDAVNGGASVVQAVAEAKRAVSAIEEALR
ncbi:MAG TPA: FAD-dependent oxidoreductase [Gaiellaceae bacterium]|nr:FAD-dependent oxidoreductase [Gaiellaceae bacterium]